jgi:hypothetical protein
MKLPAYLDVLDLRMIKIHLQGSSLGAIAVFNFIANGASTAYLNLSGKLELNWT